MIVRWFLKTSMRIYCHLIYRLKIEGKENIPKSGPAILCPNHVHALDCISFVTSLRRRVWVMAKEELFNNPIKNYLFREVDCFPVKRGKGDIEAVELAEKHIEKGRLLLIFPEGTRNLLNKGGKIKKGASRIALTENVPIIPVGINGNYKPFTKITIKVGKPMTLEGYTTGGEPNPQEVSELTERLQEEMIRLKK